VKSKFGKNNRLLRFIPIIFFVSNSIFVFSNIQNTAVTIAFEDNIEWSVTLNFSESGGANYNIVFGEATDASDGKDSYDVPNPPPSIIPYIRSWFDAGLEEPYNSLIYDIKNYPDESKIWDLYVQWVPTDYTSNNDITISWDISEISSSRYDNVLLYDYENDIIVANMQVDNKYTYTSSAMVQYHFKIICNYTLSNNPPFQPSNPYPKNEAGDVYTDITLSWSGGDPDTDDEVKYDVFFGKNPSPQKLSANQSSSSYKPGELGFNTKYYWKIVAWDNKGLSTEGLIWYFTTGSEISPPQNIPPNAFLKIPQQSYVNQTVVFDASESNDSDGFIKYYRWDFTNDGKWDTDFIEEATISHIYKINGNYSVRLQIKDNGGATDTAIKSISILPLEEGKIPPIAVTNGPYSGIINQSIKFDASESYDSDGTISNYSWNFGDGEKCYVKIATHAYNTSGTFAVTLLVVDNEGLIDKATTNAYIFFNDSDKDGWGDSEENKYGSDPYDPEDYPLDTDNDYIPDLIDENDDNDGLSDKIEEKLGSDPKNKSDVVEIKIKYSIHFLIDTNKDGKSELFYNSRSGNATEVEYKGDGKYLLDENGDGKWDYIYDSTFGTISIYKEDESSSFDLILIVIIIFICIFLIIIVVRILYKKDL
jgi:hypothetical protein